MNKMLYENERIMEWKGMENKAFIVIICPLVSVSRFICLMHRSNWSSNSLILN